MFARLHNCLLSGYFVWLLVQPAELQPSSGLTIWEIFFACCASARVQTATTISAKTDRLNHIGSSKPNGTGPALRFQLMSLVLLGHRHGLEVEIFHASRPEAFIFRRCRSGYFNVIDSRPERTLIVEVPLT